MDDLNILIKAKLSSTKEDIESQIGALNDKITKAISVKLKIDAKDLEILTEEIDKTQKKISEKTKNKNSIQIFDRTQLEKDSREFIQYYTKDIDKLESHLKNKFKDIQNISNLQLFKNSKGDVESFSAEIQKTSGEIEKLKYSLAYIQNNNKKNRGFILDTKSISQGEIPTPTLTKTAINDVDKGKNYEIFQQRLKQIESDLIKNGAEIGKVLEIADTKTGAITKATVEYTDSLGKAKTQAYELKKVYETIKDEQGNVSKQLKNIDLVPTTTTYSNNIGKQQVDNYSKIKSELGSIHKLTLEKLKLDSQDSEYAKVLDTQIKEHESILNKILTTKIKISKEEETSSINAKQSLELDKLKKANIEEIARLNAKTNDAASRTVSTTTSGKSSLGDEVSLKTPVKYNASVSELKQYAEAVAGVGAEYGKVVPKVDSLGNKFKELHVRVQEGGNKWHNYIANIDEATNKLYKTDRGLSDVINRQLSFNEAMKIAVTRIAQWGIATNLVYGTFSQIRSGINYLYELDNALNEIRIVTNKTQNEVNDLALSYNKLASEMSVTTSEITKTSADLYRQGLNDNQVEERMKSIIKYAKISSISIEDSNKIITATANATGESVDKIIDIFAYLGDTTASGADEIGESLQRVASASENSNISLEKSASWLATISSITRESSSTIGRSLNSLISRYESIKSKGFNEEDVTKINDVTKALSSIGINPTVNGQLRDISEVMDELGSSADGVSSKWDKLTKNEKAYIATALFGTFQRNRGITLLNNYKESLKNYENALNSAGIADQKFAIRQESTAASLDRFKTSIEGFWQRTLNSSILKGTLGVLTYLINTFGDLPTVIMAIVSALTLWKGTQFTKWITTSKIATNGFRASIIANRGAIIGMTQAEIAAARATTGWTLSWKALTIAMASNPIGFITTALLTLWAAFDIGKGFYNSFSASQQEASQKLEQEQESLKELKNEYDSLIKSGDLTKESKTRLKSIQDELIKTYGLEAEGLDLVNGKYQDQINIINKVIADKAKEQLASMGNSGEQALAKSKEVSSTKLLVIGPNKEVQDILDSAGVDQFHQINGTIQERVAILQKLVLALNGIDNKNVQIKGTIAKVTDEYNKLNAEMKANQTVLDKYLENKNIADFYDAFKTNISEVSDLMAKSAENPTDAGITKQLNDLHDKMINLADSKGRLGDFKSFIDELFGKMPDKAEATSENIDSIATSLSSLQKTLSDSSSSIAEVQSALDEFDKEGSFNIDTLIKLAKSHESLIPILGDEKAVHKELIQIIQDEQEKAKQAYAKMYINTQDFYNNVLLGNTTLVNELNDKYGVDLRNYSSLAEAKLKIESALLSKLGDKWSKYFSATGDLLGDVYQQEGQFGKIFLPNGEMEFITDQSVYNELKKYQDLSDRFKNIALDNTGIDFSKIGMSGKDSGGSKSGSGSDKANTPSYTSPIDAIIQEINAQQLLTAEKSKAIQTSIDQAKTDKNYQKEIELTNSLLVSQQQELADLSTARDKNNYYKDSAISTSQFGDTSRWYTGNDNQASVAYVNEYNSASKKTQEIMEQEFTTMQKLRNAWVENSTSVSTLTDEMSQLQQSLLDIKYEQITSQIDTYNNSISSTNSQLELSKSRMSLLEEGTSEYNQELSNQIALYKQLSTQQQTIIDYTKEQLKNESLSIERKQELNKILIETTKSQLDYAKSLATDVLEAQKAIEQHVLDTQEEELKEFERVHQVIIDGYQEEIDALDEKADKENESIERANKLKDIAEAQQALNNVKNEKNTRVLIGDKWVWQSNPIEVKEAQDNLKDLQTNYNDWERDNKLKHQKQALEDKIKSEQDLIKVQEDAFTKQKDAFDKQWEYLDALADKLLAQYGENVDNTVAILSEKLTSLNSQLKEIVNDVADLPDDLVDSYHGSKSSSSGGSSGGSYVSGVGYVSDTGTVTSKSGSYNTSTGNYSIIDKDGKTHNGNGSFSDYENAYDSYHEGGWVGDTSNLKSDEVPAVLQKGEFVLSEKMINNLPSFTNIMDKILNNIKLPTMNFSTPNYASILAGNTNNSKNITTDNSMNIENLTVVSQNVDSLVSQLKNKARFINQFN